MLIWKCSSASSITIFLCFKFLHVCSVTQSCPALCDPVDCTPPGFSVHEIFPERILEWVATTSSRGSFWPKDGTQVSCIAGRFFSTEPLVKNSSRYWAFFFFLSWIFSSVRCPGCMLIFGPEFPFRLSLCLFVQTDLRE